MLENYTTSAQVLALDLAGPNAIRHWREIIGPTNKETALEKAPHSLRALYARSTTENL
jgi:nucleoside-diphosphate kinase